MKFVNPSQLLFTSQMWVVDADGAAFWWNVDTFAPGTRFSVEIKYPICALAIRDSRVLIGSASSLYIVDAKAHNPTSEVDIFVACSLTFYS